MTKIFLEKKPSNISANSNEKNCPKNYIWNCFKKLEFIVLKIIFTNSYLRQYSHHLLFKISENLLKTLNCNKILIKQLEFSNKLDFVTMLLSYNQLKM